MALRDSEKYLQKTAKSSRREHFELHPKLGQCENFLPITAFLSLILSL